MLTPPYKIKELADHTPLPTRADVSKEGDSLYLKIFGFIFLLMALGQCIGNH